MLKVFFLWVSLFFCGFLYFFVGFSIFLWVSLFFLWVSLFFLWVSLFFLWVSLFFLWVSLFFLCLFCRFGNSSSGAECWTPRIPRLSSRTRHCNSVLLYILSDFVIIMKIQVLIIQVHSASVQIPIPQSVLKRAPSERPKIVIKKKKKKKEKMCIAGDNSEQLHSIHQLYSR